MHGERDEAIKAKEAIEALFNERVYKGPVMLSYMDGNVKQRPVKVWFEPGGSFTGTHPRFNVYELTPSGKKGKDSWLYTSDLIKATNIVAEPIWDNYCGGVIIRTNEGDYQKYWADFDNNGGYELFELLQTGKKGKPVQVNDANGFEFISRVKK